MDQSLEALFQMRAGFPCERLTLRSKQKAESGGGSFDADEMWARLLSFHEAVSRDEALCPGEG